MPQLRRRPPLPAGKLAAAFGAIAGTLGGVWAKVLVAPPVEWMPWVERSLFACIVLAVAFFAIAVWQYFSGETVLDWEIVPAATQIRCCRPSNRPLMLLVQPLRLRLRNRSEEPLAIGAFELAVQRRQGMRSRAWALEKFSVPRVQTFADEHAPRGEGALWGSGVTVPARSTIWCEIELSVDLRPEWEQSLRDGHDFLQVTLRTDGGEVTSQAVPVAWDLLWGAAENDGVSLDGKHYSAAPAQLSPRPANDLPAAQAVVERRPRLVVDWVLEDTRRPIERGREPARFKAVIVRIRVDDVGTVLSAELRMTDVRPRRKSLLVRGRWETVGSEPPVPGMKFAPGETRDLHIAAYGPPWPNGDPWRWFAIDYRRDEYPMRVEDYLLHGEVSVTLSLRGEGIESGAEEYFGTLRIGQFLRPEISALSRGTPLSVPPT